MGFDFATGKFIFTDFKDNIQKILQMKADGSIFPGGEGMDNDSLMAQFAAGRIGMLPGVNWDVSSLDKFWKETGTTFELGVVDTPVLNPADKHKNYAQIADVLCIGPSAKKCLKRRWRSTPYSIAMRYWKRFKITKSTLSRDKIFKLKPLQASKAGTAEFGKTSNSYFAPTPPDGVITIEGQPYQNTIINLIAGPANADVSKVLTDLTNRYNAALDKAVAGGLDLSLYVNKDWNTKSKWR